MIHIILIGGLPGSGKSIYADELGKRTPNSITTKDPMALHVLTDALDYIKNNQVESWIIESPHLTIKSGQDTMISFLEKHLNTPFNIHWILFDNNPEQCKINIDKRADGRDVMNTLIHYSKKYNTPHGATLIPVYGSQSSSPAL